MLVKDLPKDIYDVAIKHRIKQCGDYPISKDLKLDNAFAWANTPEGIIWDAVNKGNFKPFRKFHHNKLKAGDTVEYFKPFTQEDWSEFGILSVSVPFKIGDKLKIEHVSGDSNCTIMFENHHRHFPSHCFRKVEVVEEPVKESIEDFKVGDKVVFYRKPTEADWRGIGEVGIKFNIGRELTINRISLRNGSLQFKEEIATYNYPASCFRKVTTEKSLPSDWFVQCYKDIDKTPLLFEWRARNCKNPEDAKWYGDGYISSTSTHGSFDQFARFGYKEITYEQFVRDVYQPWKETQKKVLNHIHQHYEDGGKVRRVGWTKNWIQKYSETQSIDESGDISDIKWSFRTHPENWEIVAEETKTIVSEVPEYWYFPLDDCTDDELKKFQKFKDSKASFNVGSSLSRYHILLNFYHDKSYYFVSGIDSLKKSKSFKQSAVQLTKEEFYRLIYNPWQDEQSKSEKVIEKIEPSSAHAVNETDEIIITSLKRKSKLRLLSTNVENLDVKLTTLKAKKQKV